jgi:hypothetical protein
VRRKLAVVFAAVVLLVLYLHRSVVHQVCVDTALGLACLAGLCLAVAVTVRAAGRKPVQPARKRAVVQPAAVERPRASRPGDPCAEACGRPATRMFERWPVCENCGGRLDAAAACAAGRRLAPEPAEDDIPHLTQPPVIPAGETIGTIDMSDFEKRAS